MNDTAVANAIAMRASMAEKIAAAEVQIKEWRTKMSHADQFIKDWEVYSGQSVAASVVEPSRVKIVINAGVTPRSRNPKKEDVAEAARKILINQGRPMSRDDLFDALAESGIAIHGENPRVVLQTMLWRMNTLIKHIKGFGYWPSDTPFEPAGYDTTELTEALKSLF